MDISMDIHIHGKPTYYRNLCMWRRFVHDLLALFWNLSIINVNYLMSLWRKITLLCLDKKSLLSKLNCQYFQYRIHETHAGGHVLFSSIKGRREAINLITYRWDKGFSRRGIDVAMRGGRITAADPGRCRGRHFDYVILRDCMHATCASDGVPL